MSSLFISSLIKKGEGPAPELPLQLSPVEVNHISRDPKVQQYFQTLQARKDTRDKAKSWKMPATALGIGAAGYGMKRLGDAAISPDDRAALERFRDMSTNKIKINADWGKIKEVMSHPLNASANPGALADALQVDTASDYKDSSDIFWEYVDKASRAVHGKLYGHTGPEVIEKIHNTANRLGGGGPPVDPSARGIEGLDAKHYNAFYKGPFSAYVHQMGKEFTYPEFYQQPNVFFKYPNNTDAKGFLPQSFTQDSALRKEVASQFDSPVKAGLKNLSNPAEAGIGGQPSIASQTIGVGNPPSQMTNTMGGQYRQKWLGHMNDYLTSKKLPPIATAPTGFEVSPQISGMNHAQQLELAKQFAPSVMQKDPEFYGQHETLLKNLSNWQKGATMIYGNGMRVGAGLLQDVPRAVGKTMMVGGGALGAYWLLKKYLHNRQMKKHPVDVLRPPEQPTANTPQ